MSTFTKNGRIDSHISDNAVNRVFVSEASRNMAQGRPDKTVAVADRTYFEVEAEINALSAQRRQLGLEVSELQAEQSRLAGEVRGRHLPPLRYNAILAQQDQLKKQKIRLEKEISVLAGRLQALNLEAVKLKPAAEWSKSDAYLKAIAEGVEMTNNLLRELIRITERRGP